MEERDEDRLFGELIRLYGEELLRLAFTYVKNHTVSEDIVQDVFIKAFEKRKEFRGDATYRTYLYRITINKCHDYVRSWTYKNSMVLDMLHEVFKGSSSTEEIVLKNKEKLVIAESVLHLKTKYREVIVLYYYKEFQIEEIAALLQCPPNTVKTRLRRGKGLLRDYFHGEEDYFHEKFSN
ncbi:sigma-70 family RNA polymerase sigma factor [Psychrobacillus sp. NPDC096623]|uniref:sigma-70 family RNA polymerase sigma factor n=1 Tax=Psychrobacillus sp. NPDC096623 TaxID=3364492 RepID=UPI00380C107D